MLSIKELFLDSKKIEKVIKWWSINTGVTSPSSISGCYYHLRMLAKQFLRTETNSQHRISLNLCNEDLKGEENRWYRLSSRVTRENSRESIRREQGRWLELEDIQKLTRHSHERGKALVKWAAVETSSTVQNKNNKKKTTRSSGSLPINNQKSSSSSSFFFFFKGRIDFVGMQGVSTCSLDNVDELDGLPTPRSVLQHERPPTVRRPRTVITFGNRSWRRTRSSRRPN